MLKSCARLFPLLSSSLFSTIQRLGVTCVFFVHSYETFDTFSQSVSLLIAVTVRRASSRSPYRGRGVELPVDYSLSVCSHRAVTSSASVTAKSFKLLCDR